MNEVAFIVCFCQAFYFLASGTKNPMEVPVTIMHKLKSARTLADFVKHINVVNPQPAFERQTAGPGSVGRSRGGEVELKIINTQFAQLPSDGLEVIENPVQSGDSCKAFVHCVPVPLKTKPGVVYFPRCIDMPTCTGGCCDNSNNCKATKTKKVRVQVMEYTHKSNGDFYGPEITYVTMENHTECQCTSCAVPQEAVGDCGENQKWEGCRCVCRNTDDAESCTGENKVWSPQNCACQCKSNICPVGKFLDPETCQCRSISEVNGNQGSLLRNRDTAVEETIIQIPEE